MPNAALLPTAAKSTTHAPLLSVEIGVVSAAAQGSEPACAVASGATCATFDKTNTPPWRLSGAVEPAPGVTVTARVQGNTPAHSADSAASATYHSAAELIHRSVSDLVAVASTAGVAPKAADAVAKSHLR